MNSSAPDQPQPQRATADGASKATVTELQRLQHELEVQRIALETQNEELRLAQARTTAALEHYTDHFDFAPVGYFNLSPDGTIQLTNLTGATLLGSERARLLGRPFAAFIVPGDRPALHQFLTQVFASGTQETCELTLLAEPAAKRIVRLDATRSPDATDCRMVLLDITAQHAASDDRRESQARTRLLVQAAGIGLWDWNFLTDAVYFSPEWKQQLGYADHEIPNQFSEWEQRLHPDDHARTLDAVREFRDGHRPAYDAEFRLRHRDGSWRWIFSRADFSRDASGRPVHMMGCHFDITERRQAEAERRISEDRLREAQTISRLGNFHWDAATNVVTWSDELFRIYGHEPAGFTPSFENYLAAVHSDDRARVQAALEQAMATKEKFDHDYRAVLPDGQERWVHARGRAIATGEGHLCGLEGTCQDITERKQAEAELRRLAQRLVQAGDEERRRIARELHDSTAQDLVAVLMNLALLQEHLGTRDIIASQIVADSTALLENSVTDIRTLAYLAHPPQLDETGLAGALTDYAHGFSQRTAIRVHMEIPPGLPRLPEPCEMALFRVVQESLANVHRHAQSENATIRLAQSNGAVILEIADTGHGFSLEKAARPGALGVGIPGMRERMQYCGGRLEVESGSGGTVIRAVVPQPAEAT